MKKRRHTKLIHEGDYVAKVNLELMDATKAGFPTCHLMMQRSLTTCGTPFVKEISKRATRLANIYTLKPVTASTRAR